MAGTVISVERLADGVAAFILDRPERGNALSADMVEALLDAFGQALADPAVHTIVLRAQGRHFCTGFDLAELETETDASLLARFVRIEQLLDTVWRAPVRTVALGQGRIMGAGADLFAACDLRLLAPGAGLRFPGAGFGIVLGTRRLAQRVGDATAMRWVTEATTITDEQAIATGLADALLDAQAAAAAASGRLLAQSPQLAACLSAPGVDRETFAALRAAVRDRDADADLAALVRSAARPGLKARIESYRARQLEARRR